MTRPMWRETGTLQAATIRDEPGSWMVFCDELGCGDAVVSELRDRGLDVIKVRRPGGPGADACILDPSSETAYQED